MLRAPAGAATRPTGQRARQAVFNVLAHASWGGRALLDGATVLDAFAGTGAMGLEALSRGAAHAVFMERDAGAVAALRANVVSCGVDGRSQVLVADVTRPPGGDGRSLVFLDPPYDSGLLEPACAALRQTGWIRAGAIVIAETPRSEHTANYGTVLAQKEYGVAQMTVWREN